ncbi:MAG TPA: MarR family transcriptional regulator [Gemmatimonadaceae bacterium]|nr:MarR family transcriptional regulator [Gemmatimonadaceae bacterium]
MKTKPRSRPPRRTSPSEEHVQTVLDGLREINRTLRNSARGAEQRLGVSGAQLLVLQRLAERPAESLSELAERTFTHYSSVSTVVARLVERGLVVREASADDARRVRLAASARGRALLQRAPDAAEAQVVAALRQLPQTTLATLARALTTVAAQVAEAGRAPLGVSATGRRA